MYRASLVARMIKNLPAVKDIWVWFPGREDAPENGMATHSGILVWVHEQRSLAGYSPWGRKELNANWVTNTFTFHNSTYDT